MIKEKKNVKKSCLVTNKIINWVMQMLMKSAQKTVLLCLITVALTVAFLGINATAISSQDWAGRWTIYDSSGNTRTLVINEGDCFGGMNCLVLTMSGDRAEMQSVERANSRIKFKIQRNSFYYLWDAQLFTNKKKMAGTIYMVSPSRSLYLATFYGLKE